MQIITYTNFYDDPDQDEGETVYFEGSPVDCCLMLAELMAEGGHNNQEQIAFYPTPNTIKTYWLNSGDYYLERVSVLWAYHDLTVINGPEVHKRGPEITCALEIAALMVLPGAQNAGDAVVVRDPDSTRTAIYWLGF